MNATEIEFSAKSLRNRFGIMNAIPKASEKELVPRKCAFVISRISPRMRENKVRTESESPFANNDFCLFLFMIIEEYCGIFCFSSGVIMHRG